MNDIRETMIDLVAREKQNAEYRKQLQSECTHETSVYKCEGSSGDWDRDPSYWYTQYCYDCQRRWAKDQDGKPDTKLKVHHIDYNMSPEKAEMLIKLSKMK